MVYGVLKIEGKIFLAFYPTLEYKFHESRDSILFSTIFPAFRWNYMFKYYIWKEILCVCVKVVHFILAFGLSDPSNPFIFTKY